MEPCYCSNWLPFPAERGSVKTERAGEYGHAAVPPRRACPESNEEPSRALVAQYQGQYTILRLPRAFYGEGGAKSVPAHGWADICQPLIPLLIRGVIKPQLSGTTWKIPISWFGQAADEENNGTDHFSGEILKIFMQ
jgi:hypothetical protein